MLSYQDAQTRMARAQDRGYGKRRLLQNNTYLVQRGEDYAVRLHNTDVVTIHADGTYTLNTGGWETVTTKDRINGYGPARVYSHRGVWAVWHSSDPRMPAKIQKCRTCKGTGLVTVDDWGYVSHYQTDTHHASMHLNADGYTYPCDAWSLDFERRFHPSRAPLPLQRYSGGRTHFLRDQPETTAIVGQVRTWRGYSVIGRHKATCHNCHGSKVADYGSQQRPAIFYDGIRVDSSGMVIDPDARRMPELPEERAAREEAERHAAEKAARARKRAEAQARKEARERIPRERAEWLAGHRLIATPDSELPATVELYKAVRADGWSDNGQANGVGLYLPGRTVTAPDYRPTEVCGNGLHFCATVGEALRYDRSATRFMACAVDVASMIALGDKVKARSCTVLREVGRDGWRI
jgi:hypothetical protein